MFGKYSKRLLGRPAGLWLKRREELGNPLGVVQPVPARPPGSVTDALPDQAADFVLEIGCEELPPQEATAAVTQLRFADLGSYLAWQSSAAWLSCSSDTLRPHTRLLGSPHAIFVLLL